MRTFRDVVVPERDTIIETLGGVITYVDTKAKISYTLDTANATYYLDSHENASSSDLRLILAVLNSMGFELLDEDEWDYDAVDTDVLGWSRIYLTTTSPVDDLSIDSLLEVG